MDKARSSVTIDLPPQKAHERWTEWVGRTTPRSQPPAEGEAVAAADVGVAEGEKGRVYFSEEGSNATKVTMELSYNPQAVEAAGREPNFVERRIAMYLDRFKQEIEGATTAR